MDINSPIMFGKLSLNYLFEYELTEYLYLYIFAKFILK